MSRVKLTGIRYILRPFLGTIIRVRTNKPVVALTFDDGPHPEYTPRVLEVLAKYNAKATFFVVGDAAAKNPQLPPQIRAEGHALGNHSWTHDSFLELSADERQSQVRMWEDCVGTQPMKLFRPPYGHQTNQTRLQMWRLGYRVVGWNRDVADWNPHSVDDVANRLCEKIKPGAIVLLHDAIYKSRLENPQFDRHNLIAGLDKTLATLHNTYQFVTLPELLKYGRSMQVIWNMA